MTEQKSKTISIYVNVLNTYYTNHPKHYNDMLAVINKKTKISLRLIQWFINVYCANIHEYKHIHASYTMKLKLYTTKYFDMFKRGQRITFMNIQTTIGQLNFFKWASEMNIIHTLINNPNKYINLMNSKEKKHQS